jgi:hypothetical protein
MAELVDALVSNTSVRKDMPVRSRLWVQNRKNEIFYLDLPVFNFVNRWFSEIFIQGICCKNRGGFSQRAYEPKGRIIGLIFDNSFLHKYHFMSSSINFSNFITKSSNKIAFFTIKI